MHLQHERSRGDTGADRRWRWAIVSRPGQRAAMAFASVVISLAIAVAQEEHSGAAGNVAVEVIATETIGSFRSIARLLLLIITVANGETRPR